MSITITDLSDTDIKFSCDFAGDAFDYWDYTFYAYVGGSKEYMQSMNREDINQLRENCKKILDITNNI